MRLRLFVFPSCFSAETVLRVRLINPIMHGNIRGYMVALTFRAEHQRELEEAAWRVFKVTNQRWMPCSGFPLLSLEQRLLLVIFVFESMRFELPD